MKNHILYSFDENYSKVAAVSILSLLQYNKDVEIHVFTLDLSESTKTQMAKWLLEKSVNIHFYDINEEVDIYRKIYGHRMSHFGTFGRLLATKILPTDIKKILYLDCDTLIKSNLDDLFYVSMDNYYIAGVYDISLPAVNVKKTLGMNKDDFYINAGVVYLNLEKWREENLQRSFYEFCKSRPNAIFYDQDALNYVCKGKIFRLLPKYNLTFISSELPITEAKKVLDISTFKIYSEEEFLSSQKNISIIHFASELFGKPWYDISNIKYGEEWRELYKQTPWKNEPFTKRIYSKNKYINIYKKECEKLITFFYKRKRYKIVVLLYNVLYKLAHKIHKA